MIREKTLQFGCGLPARQRMVLFFLFSFLPLLGATRSALSADLCAMSYPSQPELFANVEKRQVGWQGKTNEIQIKGCASNVRGKYIMASLGPHLVDLNYVVSASYTGEFADNRCKVYDSPLATLETYQEKLAYYKKQSHFVNTCVNITVREHNGMPIYIPPDQANCTVTHPNPRDPSTVLARGGTCFFRIDRGYDYQFRYEMRSECSDPAFLSANGIEYLDVMSMAGFYVAGDPSGFSSSLDPLGMMELRATIQADSRVLPSTVDMGPFQPRWPILMGFDAHMGEIKITIGSSDVQVESSLLVDNRCGKVCANGVCNSPCDFTIPLGAEMDMYQLTPLGQVEFLDSWYVGGAAPAQWQGFIPAAPKTSSYNPYKVGGRYRLVAKMDYPDTYYRLAKTGFHQFLIDLPIIRQDMVGLLQLEGLSPLDAFLTRFPVVPGFVPVQGVSESRDAFVSRYTQGLLTLAGYLNFESWPPTYQYVCSPDLTKCGVPYSGGSSLSLGADFTVSSIDPSSGEVKLSDVTFMRTGKLLPPYSITQSRFPHVECH